MRLVLSCLLLCVAIVSGQAKISFTCDKPDGLYPAGAKAIITCEVTPKDGAFPDSLNVIITDGFYANKRTQEVSLENGIGKFTLSGEGHVVAQVKRDVKQKKPDAAIGVVFNPDALMPSLPAPDDFDAFWSAKKAALAAIPATILKREAVNWEANLTNGLHLEQITIKAWGDTPVVGILAYKKGAKPQSLPAKLGVYWAGVYGAHQGAKWKIAQQAREGFISFHINAHGITWLKEKAYYDGLLKGRLKNYANIGRADRDKNYFLGMYLRMIRGIDFLVTQPEWNGQELLVEGTSQGGGQAIVAAGIDHRVTKVVASVPAMCDHTAIAVGRPMSWPNWNHKVRGDGSWEASRYFDAIHFAERAKAPIVIGVGLTDPVCPAGNVIAAYNQYAGPKRLVTDPIADHGAKNFPRYLKEMNSARRQLLKIREVNSQ